MTPRGLGGWTLRMQIALWRQGAALPLALLLLAAAAVLEWTVTQPAQQRAAQVQDELRNALHRDAAQAASQPPAAPALTQRQQLAATQAVLRAPSADATALVRRMAALAQAQQIPLQQSDYQVQPHPAAAVVQVQITQPLRASYPQLRRYIEAVLRAMPQASLDQVSARRENVGQAQLEVRLRWSIWLYIPAADTTAATHEASAREPTRP